MDIGKRNIVFVHFFFFFQAEDGIRDLTVTGVQTCALPILEPCPIMLNVVKRGLWLNGTLTIRSGTTSSPSLVPNIRLQDSVFRSPGHCKKIGRASCRERV